MATKEPGLFALLGALPKQFSNLALKQVELVKAEYKDKLGFAIIALVAGLVSVVFLLLLLGALIVWLFVALADVLEIWVVGLIIAGSLLLIILILALIAFLAFRKIGSWKPEKSMASFQEDYELILSRFAPKDKAANKNANSNKQTGTANKEDKQ